jgi:ABC-type arginine/histidine transport system permease subunit
VDLALIRFLVSHGNKVIVAFKSGPLYTKADILDLNGDAVLAEAMPEA